MYYVPKKYVHVRLFLEVENEILVLECTWKSKNNMISYYMKTSMIKMIFHMKSSST